MRRLLQASVIFLVFATALLIVQSSCSKSQAQINTGMVAQTNKFVYLRLGNNGSEIWITDYDGNNASKVPLTMPAGTALSTDFGQWEVRLSPDGQTVFFLGVVVDAGTTQIYSCHIDGSNVKVVVPNPDKTLLRIGGAY